MPMSIPNLAQEMRAEIEAIWGTAPDSARLLQFTTAVSTSIINHMIANTTITLQAGNIGVPALGLLDSVGSPCTGAAVNAAVILNTKVT